MLSSTSQTFRHIFKLPSWIINFNTGVFRLEFQTYTLFHIIKASGSRMSWGYKTCPRSRNRCEPGPAFKVWGRGTVLEPAEVSPALELETGPERAAVQAGTAGLCPDRPVEGPSSLCPTLSLLSIFFQETGQRKTEQFLCACGHGWHWPIKLRGS